MGRSTCWRTLIAWTLLLGAGGSLRAGAPTKLPEEVRRGVEQVVFRTMWKQRIPAVSVGVTYHGRRLADGFGLADVENQVHAGPYTIYRYASLTKPITAVAALQLAEDGKLDLDVPIQRYVPGFPEKTWPLTCRQLLCHQGGIRTYRNDEVYSTKHYGSINEALAIFQNDPLEFEPGTKFLYSTYGYNLVGAVVEGASGRSFLEQIQKRVFEPAGMTLTRDDDEAAIIPGRACGYRRGPKGVLQRSALTDVSNKLPGGGLCGTADDLAGFADALMSGKLLAAKTMREMLSPQKLHSGQPTGNGLGWNVETVRGAREVWKSGNQPQVSTLMLLRPEQELGVVLLSNLEDVKLLEAAQQIAEVVRETEARATGSALQVVP